MRTLLIALSCLLLSVQAVYFKIVPNGKECVGVKAIVGDKINVSFDAVGGDKALRVTLTAPDSNDFLYNEQKGSGQFTVTAEKNGRYELCMKSTITYIQTLSFNVRVHHKSEVPPDQAATSEDAVRLNNLAEQLTEKIDVLEDQLTHGSARAEAYREKNASLNSSMHFWTVVQLLTVVVLAVAQAVYLRRKFEPKSFV